MSEGSSPKHAYFLSKFPDSFLHLGKLHSTSLLHLGTMSISWNYQQQQQQKTKMTSKWHYCNAKRTILHHESWNKKRVALFDLSWELEPQAAQTFHHSVHTHAHRWPQKTVGIDLGIQIHVSMQAKLQIPNC